MKKKREFTLNVGISSILFIFVVLCLVSFSILSLSSAMSDYKLTERVKENTEAYYNACNEAETLLASFDATLSELYSTGVSRTGYYDKVGKKKIFSVPVTDIQTLTVEINILFPEESGLPFYVISKWQVETTGDIEYDDSLNVFK